MSPKWGSLSLRSAPAAGFGTALAVDLLKRSPVLCVLDDVRAEAWRVQTAVRVADLAAAPNYAKACLRMGTRNDLFPVNY